MNIMPPFELWFVIITTVVFAFAFVTWTKKDWLNLFLKVLFFVLTVWGIILIYDQGIL